MVNFVSQSSLIPYFIAQIWIHYVAEYGSNLDPDPQNTCYNIKITVKKGVGALNQPVSFVDPDVLDVLLQGFLQAGQLIPFKTKVGIY